MAVRIRSSRLCAFRDTLARREVKSKRGPQDRRKEI